MSEYFKTSKQANESIDKYKLLSAYGGPGSLIHTQYGSIIISCIEEWGFLNEILQLKDDFSKLNETAEDERNYVIKFAQLGRNGNIGISNDDRLLKSLKQRKGLIHLEYLVLIPNIELNDFNNQITNDKTKFSIPSTYMPKIFADRMNTYKPYKKWFDQWVKDANDKYAKDFFPPKKLLNSDVHNLKCEVLTQDNIVLICEHGHISDFPWSQYLNWRSNGGHPNSNSLIDLFNYELCCGTSSQPTAEIRIQSSAANASGFDGKWLKCNNCNKGTSLVGLMGVKIKCSGHKPWEAKTGENKYYTGNKQSRIQTPPSDHCKSNQPMKVALTTGNNLYYSRVLSSIYMPNKLFKDDISLKIEQLEIKKREAVSKVDFKTAMHIQSEIEELNDNTPVNQSNDDLSDSEREIQFRNEEYRALVNKNESDINIQEEDLKVRDVTNNLNDTNRRYFHRILRIDNLKVTSAQLDFSRVMPADADSSNIMTKNIFRSKPEDIFVYPAVESYGEGIFFAFDEKLILSYSKNSTIINNLNSRLDAIYKEHDSFSKQAIEYAKTHNWQLYLVHTFSHLIMKELEFRCGYPTASLSERVYVSNDEQYQMYGCMIYTAEGAEGSMGGLIAQTNTLNLNNLIKSALHRATICNSDPLCWESEGQGLFDLNFASCFSCSLVSETSCELRNIYLDRKILVNDECGFFKDIL